MAKVIVERPRYGSSTPSRRKGYRKYLQSMRPEDLPRREPMLGCWRGRDRVLNEHLGPMRRFLRSNVGRPWNKVHQELCEHVSFDNAVQKHVLTHVFDDVAIHVEIHEGRLVHRDGWQRGQRVAVGAMYVCPKTGLLKVVRRPKSRHVLMRIATSVGLMSLQRDGEWWEVQVRKLPDDPRDLWDVWLERDVCELTLQDCHGAYGGELYAVSKRAMMRDEIRLVWRRNSGNRHRRSIPADDDVLA